MVSEISSINVSSSSFIATSSQALTLETKQKLERFGIDTKSIKTETEGQTVLQTTLTAQEADKANKVSTQLAPQAKPAGAEPPWVSLMEQNKIAPTGTTDGDKMAVNAYISGMTDKKAAKSLAEQFGAVGLAITVPAEDKKESDKDLFAGQNQVAEMNKYFLLK